MAAPNVVVDLVSDDDDGDDGATPAPDRAAETPRPRRRPRDGGGGGGDDPTAVIDCCSEESSIVDLTRPAADASESEEDSVVDLTLPAAAAAEEPSSAARAAPSTPSKKKRPPAKKKKVEKAKHATHRKDWEGLPPDVPRREAYVYVIENLKGSIYTGAHVAKGDAVAEEVACAHNAGLRRSTRRRRPWTAKVLVGPFAARTAALRFERVVKVARGGPTAKAAAARAALRRAKDARAVAGIAVKVIS